MKGWQYVALCAAAVVLGAVFVMACLAIEGGRWLGRHAAAQWRIEREREAA